MIGRDVDRRTFLSVTTAGSGIYVFGTGCAGQASESWPEIGDFGTFGW